jgi:hypothetical protein
MQHVILCLALVTWAVSANVVQKRTVELPVMVDYYNVPTTLEGLLGSADAVVIARITSSRDRTTEKRPLTEHGFRLVRAFKEHPRLMPRARVCQAIGTVELPDRILTRYDPHFPAFTPDSEYLLFLSWDEGTECFWPKFGPSSAAAFDGAGLVKPFTSHPALDGLKGLNGDKLGARIAAAGRK